MSKTTKQVDLKRLLFELTASNPDKVDEILCLDATLQQLQSRVKELEEYVEEKLAGPHQPRDMYAPLENGVAETSKPKWAEAKRYLWLDNSLHERREGETGTVLQVSSSDWEKVLDAMQLCLNNNQPIKVPLIRKHMKKKSQQVPSTQIYLCLRYLKSKKMLQKCSAGSYEYCGEGTKKQFRKKSMNIAEEEKTNIGQPQ